MRRILILTHHDLSTGSGDIARVKKLGNLLSQEWVVRFAHFPGYSVDMPLRRLYLNLPRWAISTVRTIVQFQPAWVFVSNTPQLVVLCHFIRRPLRMRFNLAYDCVLTWKMVGRSPLWVRKRELWEELAMRNADLLVTVSPPDSLPISAYANKVIVLPTFVDTQTFRPSAEARARIRSRYAIPPGVKVVGIVGPFDNMYNRPALSYLRLRMLDFNSQIRFLILGRFLEEDHFPSDRIIWAGHVADYVDHLAALDAALVLRTIPTDGAMNKLLEVMAMEVPVFTTHEGHATFRDSVSGKHLFVHAPEDLPQAINRIISSNELLRSIGSQARSLVQTNCSASGVGANLLKALKSTALNPADPSARPAS